MNTHILLRLLLTTLALLTTACGDTANADDDCMTVEVARMDSDNNCYYYDENPKTLCLPYPIVNAEISPVYYYSETSDEIVWVPGAHPQSAYEALKEAGFATCYEDSPNMQPGCFDLSACNQN